MLTKPTPCFSNHTWNKVLYSPSIKASVSPHIFNTCYKTANMIFIIHMQQHQWPVLYECIAYIIDWIQPLNWLPTSGSLHITSKWCSLLSPYKIHRLVWVLSSEPLGHKPAISPSQLIFTIGLLYGRFCHFITISVHIRFSEYPVKPHDILHIKYIGLSECYPENAWDTSQPYHHLNWYSPLGYCMEGSATL